ncbi:MAG: 30S ribosomal protein S19e [Candidatus Woesearchaeota archaeon]
MNVKEYKPDALIEHLAKELQKMPECSAPEWTQFVKTGVHKQRPPVDEDWWFQRLASILRKVALKGPIGVNKLRREYGGKYRRGYAPAKFAKGSGKIIRVGLQQLESAKLIKQVTVDGHKGRVLDTKGTKCIAEIAKNLRGTNDGDQ